jgi:hypothetical protein
VERCLNSSKALNGRKEALDPKVKDELVKTYFIFLTISDMRRLAISHS